MKLFGKWRKEALPGEEVPFATDEPIIGGDTNGQAPIGQNRKILVVDDNAVVLKAFELKMKSLGFKVLTASDGSSAVSIARQERPDLIVLDINFPPDVGSSGLQWNGFNIMEWMRRFREVAEIPVIIITSGEPEKYRERALSSGASAFFQKPINHEDFLLAVRRILGHNSSVQTDSQQVR
jgi:two-component system cell cycle response regulator DivK